MAPPRKRPWNLMPIYLNTKPDESGDFDEFNQRLNNLPAESNVTSDEDAQFRRSRSRKSQSNVNRRNGMSRELDNGYYPSKRRQKEAPCCPWNDLSTIPPLEPYPSPESISSAKFIVEKKCLIPVPSFKEVAANARRCLNTSPMPVSSESASNTNSGSDITKEDVKNNSPLDSKDVQGPSTSNDIKSEKPKIIKVYSFADLITTTNRGNIQTKERSLNHEKKLGIGVDIVEPMKCNEATKCEVNADTMSLQKRNKRGVSLVERFTAEEIKLHIMSLTKPSIQVTYLAFSLLFCFLFVF